MPRPRKNALFELDGQWLAREPGHANLYRYWTDTGTGITRRASLGTTDIEQAKKRLAEIVVAGAPKNLDSLLSAVLLDYFRQRTDNLPCKKQSRNAGRVMLKCWGENIRVRALTDAKQREFGTWCHAQGFSLAYVARNLTVLKAALNHANLMPPSKIICAESKMRDKWGLVGREPERAYIPTDAEIIRFFRAKMPEPLRRWAIVCLTTACRPSAALDLAPMARQRDIAMVCLNPQGRAQNKKYRPTVRSPRVLAACMNAWEREGLDAFGGRYCGYATVEGVKTALERVRSDNGVNIPRLSMYSFRHKAVTVLRLARVPEDQIALQTGHRRRDLRMTTGYGEFDPDYLRDAARAFDCWFLRIRRAVNSHDTLTASAPAKKARPKLQVIAGNFGAGDANRTRDPNLGKVMLYP